MNTLELIEISVVALSLFLALISFFYTLQTKRRYEKVALRLGNGTDISEILKKYIEKVNEISDKDDQIIEYCNKINDESFKFIKKIGLIKYDSYGSTRNKLSFALALLNKENSGIVLNSVYGPDSSNIYAKSVIKGDSKYNLSSEEKEAIEEAIKNNN